MQISRISYVNNYPNKYNPNFQGFIKIQDRKNDSNPCEKPLECEDDEVLAKSANENFLDKYFDGYGYYRTKASVPFEDLNKYLTQVSKVTGVDLPLNKNKDVDVTLMRNDSPEGTTYSVETNRFKIKHSFSKSEIAAKKVLSKYKKLGPEEYENLSEQELKVLKQYADEFTDNNSTYVDLAILFGTLYSNRLHEQYPDGYTFVSVGRTPALIAKYLEFQGVNVKYCPISAIRTDDIDFSPEYKQLYKKYLDSIGLTKDSVEESAEPVIITDFTFSGNSLLNFKNLLASPEIGIEEGEKVKYRPLTAGEGFPHESAIFYCDPFIDRMCQYYEPKFPYKMFKKHMIAECTHKEFSSVPQIPYYNTKELDKYFENGNVFEESFNAKMMNFCIAEYLNQNNDEEQT